MPVNPLRVVVDLIAGATELTRSGAEELLAVAAANRSMIEDIVSAEVDNQLRRLGLATRGDLLSAQAEVMRLRAEVEELRDAIAGARERLPRPQFALAGFETNETLEEQSRTTKRVSPTRASAKKATTKRGTAKKTTTKRATANKATAKKTTARKTTAQKVPAKRVGVKGAPITREQTKE